MVVESKSYYRWGYNLFLFVLALVFMGALALADRGMDLLEVLTGWMSGHYIWNIFHIVAALLAMIAFCTLLGGGVIGVWMDKLEKMFDYTLRTEFTETYVKFIRPHKTIEIAYDDIRDVMVWPIIVGRGEVNPMAYALIIRANNRKYKLYSETLSQMEYHEFKETELYQVYWGLRQRVAQVNW